MECPRCREKFNDSKDYALLLGDVIGGNRSFRKTEGYDIIICLHCDNCTARVMLESYRVSDLVRAEKLVQEGFVNLSEVEVWGDVKDGHVVYATLPNLRVHEAMARKG